jgi:hypothetical protein
MVGSGVRTLLGAILFLVGENIVKPSLLNTSVLVSVPTLETLEFALKIDND